MSIAICWTVFVFNQSPPLPPALSAILSFYKSNPALEYSFDVTAGQKQKICFWPEGTLPSSDENIRKEMGGVKYIIRKGDSTIPSEGVWFYVEQIDSEHAVQYDVPQKLFDWLGSIDENKRPSVVCPVRFNIHLSNRKAMISIPGWDND
ncbi:MAG: hypothetical protein U1E46_10470 [Hyphomicrobiales bacterium]